MAERPTPDPMSPVMRAALLRGLTTRRSPDDRCPRPRCHGGPGRLWQRGQGPAASGSADADAPRPPRT